MKSLSGYVDPPGRPRVAFSAPAMNIPISGPAGVGPVAIRLLDGLSADSAQIYRDALAGFPVADKA